MTWHAQAPPGTLGVLDLAGAPLPLHTLGVGPLAAHSLRGQLRQEALGARARAPLRTHCGGHWLLARGSARARLRKASRRQTTAVPENRTQKERKEQEEERKQTKQNKKDT